MDKLNLLSSVLSNGITGRKLDNQRSIIRYLSKAESSKTIPEISDFIGVSIPIATNLVRELVKKKLLLIGKKKVSENGRRPKTYSLNREKFYVVGVEILSKFIHVSLVSTDFDTKYQLADRNFVLESSFDCLRNILEFVQKAISESKVKPKDIIGVGIGITTVRNLWEDGKFAFFKEADITLEEYLSTNLSLPILIDSDTRSISIAEQSLGLAKGVDNALIVKVSRLLGMGIIVDKHIVKGQFGLAGNFNHVKLGDGLRPCQCGKIGCLGTQIGGDALLFELKKALLADNKSYFFKKELVDEYSYHDILNATLKGDELAINLLQEQGKLLGKALGNTINLLAPELVVIAGEFTMVSDFFIDAINIGIGKTALIEVRSSCDIETSSLGRYLGSKAGACMILKAAKMTEY